MEENRDFVYIYDGDLSAPEIASLTGHDITGPFDSTGNVMTVRMFSDSTINMDGFQAQPVFYVPDDGKLV